MSLGKGLKPPTAAKNLHRLAAELHPRVAAALAAGPRGSADLTPFAPPVRNQAGETCAFHSASTLRYTAMGAAGKPLAYVPSPLYYAQCVYSMDRALMTPVGQPLPALEDTGTELADAASVFSVFGEIPFQADAGAPTDVVLPIPELEPAEVQRGVRSLFSGEYAIVVDESAPSVVAAALDAGIPCWWGGPVNGLLEGLQPGQIAQPAPPNASGHALSILGYRTVNGEIQVRVRNSWGVGFCEGGDFWASSAFIRSAWQLFPFAVAAGS